MSISARKLPKGRQNDESGSDSPRSLSLRILNNNSYWDLSLKISVFVFFSEKR
jgi:hypothetical protein